MKLNLFVKKSLPIDFIKRHSVFAGESGAGKSYLVSVLSEELSRLNIPFTLIDTQNANLNVVKLPNTKLINPLKDSAIDAAIAISHTNLNAIIKNPLQMPLERFLSWCSNFIKEYIKREQKALRLLIIDEAHIHAPRLGKSPNSAILKRIVTGFRSEGLFVCCVTQRLVELNTTIVNQSPSKVMLRMTGLNDAKRVLDILSLKMSKKEAEQAVQEMQGYKQGEAFVISNIELD